MGRDGLMALLRRRNAPRHLQRSKQDEQRWRQHIMAPVHDFNSRAAAGLAIACWLSARGRLPEMAIKNREFYTSPTKAEHLGLEATHNRRLPRPKEKARCMSRPRPKSNIATSSPLLTSRRSGAM